MAYEILSYIERCGCSLKGTVLFCWLVARGVRCLAAEAVQSAALAFQSVDDIHGGDSLPLGVLGVGDSISDDVIQESLQHSTSLLIDETRDPLDSSTTSQSPDGRLGDALDVVPQHLAMTLGSSLSESLASFASSTHVETLVVYQRMMAERKFLVFI